MAQKHQPLSQGETARPPGEDIKDKREEARTAQDAEEVANHAGGSDSAPQGHHLLASLALSHLLVPLCLLSRGPVGITSPPGLQMPLWDEQTE